MTTDWWERFTRMCTTRTGSGRSGPAFGVGPELITGYPDREVREISSELGRDGKYDPRYGRNRVPYVGYAISSASETAGRVKAANDDEDRLELERTYKDAQTHYRRAEREALLAIERFWLALLRVLGVDEQAERDGQPIPHDETER